METVGQQLLAHMDNLPIKDEMGNIITNSKVTINATATPFNGNAYFNGASYLKINNSICNFGTNDFTIGCRIKMPPSASYPCLIGNNISKIYNGIYPSDAEASNMVSMCNGSGARILSSTVRIDDNMWHHLVFQRKGGVLKIIIDGILNNSTPYTSNINWNALSDIYIGYDGTQSNSYLTGSLDEFIISNGIAKYPDNFTPPTRPYPFMKYLIKQDQNYYTINDGYFDSIGGMFTPLSLYGITSPNTQDIETYGFEDISKLNMSTTIGTETFIPIDKLNNNFEIKLYSK